MQRGQGRSHAAGQLQSLRMRDRPLLEQVGQVRVRDFEDCIGQRRSFKISPAEALDLQQVYLANLGHPLPALHHLPFIVQRFRKPDDGWRFGASGQREQGASAFGPEKLAERVHFCDGFSFVVVPKLHSQSVPVPRPWVKKLGKR